MNKLKNAILLLTVVLAQVHTFFHGVKTKVDWYILIDFSRRIDYAVMNLTTSLNFLIISFCLLKPKGLNPEIKKFIFIVCCLDLAHYLLVSKLQFGLVKIFLAVLIWLFIYVKNNFNRVRNNIYNILNEWTR